MAYLQQNGWKHRPGTVAGVIGIHALIGYALVSGLSFDGFVETVRNPQSIFVPEVKLPPPPPPPEPTVEPNDAAIDRPIVTPKPIIDVSPVRPRVDTTEIILPSVDPMPKVGADPTPGPTQPARPAFDPVGAKPKGNPSSWVTVDDYRSSWVNRELTGTARFRLEVAANGRVENCTITASSGHAELDKATCSLVAQRARFDPAKDATGAKVVGSYSNSVRWELPE
jgi:protein TonB